MAEGLLGGVLAGDDENADASAPQALTGAEAFAAAVAAIASRQDPQVARDTSAFLKTQAQLLETQTRHLEDEHPLRVAHLREQSHLLRGQRVSQGIRIAFQVATALIAVVIGVGIAVMLHDAFNSRSVVVDPFEAPARLAALGVTSTVVASAVLDDLTRMQGATRSTAAAKRDLSGAWSNDVKLAVPEAGVSLAELVRLLKARLGHDVHIGGDLVETRGGELALTVRGSNLSPQTFTGAADELNRLTAQAAEYVYAKSQPLQWAAYLGNTGRYEEQIAFCRSAYASSTPVDRAYLLIEWGRALEHAGHPTAEGLALYRAAIDLKPDLWMAYHHLMNSLMALGDEEGAWRAGEHMRHLAGGRPGLSGRAYDNWDLLTWNSEEWLGALVADANASAGLGTAGDVAGVEIAYVQSRLHDVQAAELTLQTTHDDPKEPVIGATRHFVRGRLATEVGDTARAAAEMEAFQSAYVDPAVSANIPSFNCWIAPAEEAAGHRDQADAVLKTAGAFVDCYRFRADILDGRGDWPGAETAYAQTVALAPDLPAGYFSWGLALAKHGDLAGAAAKLAAANQRGPHWADPLKAWGDVLAKQGHTREARAKYDAALEYAPNWQELKAAREVLAKPRG
jgi:tetratricopeptide (TPR) repeat protein